MSSDTYSGSNTAIILTTTTTTTLHKLYVYIDRKGVDAAKKWRKTHLINWWGSCAKYHVRDIVGSHTMNISKMMIVWQFSSFYSFQTSHRRTHQMQQNSPRPPLPWYTSNESESKISYVLFAFVSFYMLYDRAIILALITQAERTNQKNKKTKKMRTIAKGGEMIKEHTFCCNSRVTYNFSPSSGCMYKC